MTVDSGADRSVGIYVKPSQKPFPRLIVAWALDLPLISRLYGVTTKLLETNFGFYVTYDRNS